MSTGPGRVRNGIVYWPTEALARSFAIESGMPAAELRRYDIGWAVVSERAAPGIRTIGDAFNPAGPAP